MSEQKKTKANFVLAGMVDNFFLIVYLPHDIL